LEDLLALGRETMDVANAHLVFIDPERDHHEVVRADGSAAFERGDTSPLSESYCRHSFGDANAAEPHGRGGVAPDANGFAFHDPDDPALDGDPAHERHGAGCYLSEPVYRDGELYGTVCFADARPREAFAEAERQFAVLLSTHVGRLLERVDGTGTPLRDD
jgi:GAF domain-containing protein